MAQKTIANWFQDFLARKGWEPPFEEWLREAVAAPATDPSKAMVGQLVQAAQAKEVATKAHKGPEQAMMAKSAQRALDALVDDLCPPWPRWPRPWPWPGPPPQVWEVVSQLTLAANQLQAGGLREDLLSIAGTISARNTTVGG